MAHRASVDATPRQTVERVTVKRIAMGKLANTLRGIALPLDKQNAVRALDRELDGSKRQT